MSSNVPAELHYAKSHEWAKLEGDIVTVGITEFAVEQMNREIINVEIPEKGRTLAREESFGVIDSVMAAFDVFSPVAGEVVEINSALVATPELVANSPYGEGWIIKIKANNPADDMAHLMTATEYMKMIEEDAGH